MRAVQYALVLVFAVLVGGLFVALVASRVAELVQAGSWPAPTM